MEDTNIAGVRSGRWYDFQHQIMEQGNRQCHHCHKIYLNLEDSSLEFPNLFQFLFIENFFDIKQNFDLFVDLTHTLNITAADASVGFGWRIHLTFGDIDNLINRIHDQTNRKIIYFYNNNTGSIYVGK